MSVGGDGGVDTVVDAEGVEELGDVLLDGAFGQMHGPADLGVGESASDVGEELDLALGEQGSEFVSRGSGAVARSLLGGEPAGDSRGERASAVREGASEAWVEAVFSLADSRAVDRLLDDASLPLCEEGALLVRRSVAAAGAGRCLVNDTPTTVQTLRRLGSLLVDIHGPYDHQSLLDPDFQRDVLDAYGHCAAVRDAYSGAWRELQTLRARLAAYRAAYPELAAEFERRMAGDLPANWAAESAKFIADLQANPAKIATRKASQNALDAFGALLPELLGGSADLAPSNLTFHKSSKSVTPEDASGNYIHYGVREFGMSAIMNGATLHGGLIPYGATFLMFMEYARNAVRMAALMKQRSIFVYTHDSIGLGEDGPTHQPVEQIASLRLTPNMSTWRPCDQVESAVAWKYAIERKDGPTALIFSRQNLAQMERTAQQLADVAKGGYVLKDAAGTPDLILIATGSEVELVMAAATELEAKGRKVRVVSIPATDVFDAQSTEYKESVLPSAVTRRVAVEAGIADYWYKYVGLNGKIVGMHTFGESAPAELLFQEFGFTVENVVAQAESLF